MEEELLEDQFEDERIDDMEDDRELREELDEDEQEAYGVPNPEEVYDKFKFMTEVRDREDTIRSSYLTTPELGSPLFPVRFWLNLQIIARIKGYKILENYLSSKALVTTHTGLSREGFLLNTVITKRKERSKGKTNYGEVEEKYGKGKKG